MQHFFEAAKKMKHQNSPIVPRKSAAITMAALCITGALVASGVTARAQSFHLIQFVEQSTPFLLHSSSQGYLGVYLADVDTDHQQSLKLKDSHGALITLIDHDAPAGKIGLRVNDVVLQINGLSIQTSEQLRRVLAALPAGHKVQLVISRDGNTLHFEVQLADRKMIARNMQEQIHAPASDSNGAPGMAILGNTGTADYDAPTGFFHWWTGGANLNVGATVEPLTAQMSDYLGLPNGLMVKAIIKKSEADSAGLKTHDIILKVGTESIATIADWERALHSNQDKPVPVTILRDKKQITITLQVDSKHHKSSTRTETAGLTS
jgi:serine protease Do